MSNLRQYPGNGFPHNAVCASIAQSSGWLTRLPKCGEDSLPTCYGHPLEIIRECGRSQNMLTVECRDSLNLLPLQAEETAPQDDFFEGHPGGAYRGLASAILFTCCSYFS